MPGTNASLINAVFVMCTHLSPLQSSLGRRGPHRAKRRPLALALTWRNAVQHRSLAVEALSVNPSKQMTKTL
jgi:hypothetical protein